jgi:hypothetical protein
LTTASSDAAAAPSFASTGMLLLLLLLLLLVVYVVFDDDDQHNIAPLSRHRAQARDIYIYKGEAKENVHKESQSKYSYVAKKRPKKDQKKKKDTHHSKGLGFIFSFLGSQKVDKGLIGPYIILSVYGSGVDPNTPTPTRESAFMDLYSIFYYLRGRKSSRLSLGV